MDNKLNIVLVGYGRFSKIYLKELKKIKIVNIKKIYRKKKIKLNKKIFSNLNLKKKMDKNLNIHAAIIVSNVNSHYKLASYFIKNKIPIILEKPACEKLSQIKRIYALAKKHKITVIVNYSDLYNYDFIKFYKKFKKLKHVKNIEIDINTLKNYYLLKKKITPLFDWLPHIFAIILKLVGSNIKIINIKDNLKKEKNNFLQSSMIYLKNNNIFIKVNFSNLFLKKKRKVTIFNNGRSLIYDGNKINKTKNKLSPINSLLTHFIKLIKLKKFFTNLDETIIIHKYIEKVLR